MESGSRAFSAAIRAGWRRSPEGGRSLAFSTRTLGSLGRLTITFRYRVCRTLAAWSTQTATFARFGQRLTSAVHVPILATLVLNPLPTTFQTPPPLISPHQTLVQEMEYLLVQAWGATPSADRTTRPLTQRLARPSDCRTCLS